MIVPFGNGLILGYLMYKFGLVPRRNASAPIDVTNVIKKSTPKTRARF